MKRRGTVGARSARSRVERVVIAFALGFGALTSTATATRTPRTTRPAVQCPDGSPPPCRASARPAAVPSNSVAVLYFDNRSRDSSDLSLADGVTEEIITRLAGVERLTVRSRHLVQRYRGQALADPAAIGRALGVSYIVTGSVRRAGGRLRLSAELIRADGGRQVWGRNFDQLGDDVFAIQEAVAGEVATGIVGRLLPSETRAIAVRPTNSTAAYEAFLRGNFHVARRDSIGMSRAVAEYERALRLDPSYTDALSRVAMAYGISHGNGTRMGLPLDSVAARAMRAASEAIRRAPSSSDAWLAMGIARVAASPRTFAGVREALERAIALDPTNAEPHHLLGFVHQVFEEDSLSAMHDRHALAINPARPVTIMHFAHGAVHRGRYAEARRWLDSVLVVNPEFQAASMAQVPILFLTGDTARARRLWRERRPAPGRPLSITEAGYLSMAALVLDADTNGALAILEAGAPRGAFLRWYLTMPVYDPIRAHPRFVALLRELSP